MAKSARVTSGETQTTKAVDPTVGEWVTIPLVSEPAKVIKVRISELADQIAAARAELENLAKPWIAANYGAAPKGRELKFSHRFGLGFSFLPPTASKTTKKVSAPKNGI